MTNQKLEELKKKIAEVVLILPILLLTGCRMENFQSNVEEVDVTYDVKRIEDDKYNVVCWQRSINISCLPKENLTNQP